MVAVLGEGAVVLAVPAVATVYHCRVCPVKAVAVKAVAVAPWHKLTVVVATGATGEFIEIAFVTVIEHPLMVYV